MAHTTASERLLQTEAMIVVVDYGPATWVIHNMLKKIGAESVDARRRRVAHASSSFWERRRAHHGMTNSANAVSSNSCIDGFSDDTPVLGSAWACALTRGSEERAGRSR